MIPVMESFKGIIGAIEGTQCGTRGDIYFLQSVVSCVDVKKPGSFRKIQFYDVV